MVSAGLIAIEAVPLLVTIAAGCGRSVGQSGPAVTQAGAVGLRRIGQRDLGRHAIRTGERADAWRSRRGRRPPSATRRACGARSTGYAPAVRRPARSAVASGRLSQKPRELMMSFGDSDASFDRRGRARGRRGRRPALRRGDLVDRPAPAAAAPARLLGRGRPAAEATAVRARRRRGAAAGWLAGVAAHAARRDAALCAGRGVVVGLFGVLRDAEQRGEQAALLAALPPVRWPRSRSASASS